MNLKNNEDFLYALVDELSREDAPIIFKGGLALKDILYLYNDNLLVERKTVDIDGNWTDIYDKEKITHTLEKALNNIDSTLKLELTREPGNNRSMGFDIKDAYGQFVTSIDLDIKDNPFYIVCNINDVSRRYSSLEKIMTDKLMALSGTHIFRRTKDILDVFLIINNYKIDLNKVFDVLKYENKTLGDFSTMLNNKDLLKDAYDKLGRIKGKPEFNEVWDSVIKYLESNKLLDATLSNEEDNNIEI